MSESQRSWCDCGSVYCSNAVTLEFGPTDVRPDVMPSAEVRGEEVESSPYHRRSGSPSGIVIFI